MAGTCKYCGADTWGRYRICPDCRKERKRKGVYRSGWDSLGGSINLGERYVCKKCDYRWESKKKWGTPAICPKCKSENITPFYETPEGKRELIEREEESKEDRKRENIKNIIKLGVFIGVIITFILLINSNNFDKNKSTQDLIGEMQEECLSNGGFYYSQTCTPLESIQNHKNLCNADGMKPIIFLTGSGGNWDCYKGKIESDKLSESQKTEVLNCENLGEVPVITDKVNCVELTSSSQSSNQETIYPEEELINFCISQFSNAGIFDLKKTDYQNDFSSASDWIRNNYENSALTQEQKEHNINYIIENQLPKQGYPIVITSGSKKDGQVTSKGFYYCNEKGIIN